MVMMMMMMMVLMLMMMLMMLMFAINDDGHDDGDDDEDLMLLDGEGFQVHLPSGNKRNFLASQCGEKIKIWPHVFAALCKEATTTFHAKNRSGDTHSPTPLNS
eukprot:10316069-Karenia_brevis.AAC.1